MVFGSVAGRVTDAVTLLPIQGAHVMLRPAQVPQLKAGRPRGRGCRDRGGDRRRGRPWRR
jgi:hypothetical protein